MLKQFGKWATKTVAGYVVGEIIGLMGGGVMAQEVGKAAAKETVEELWGN